MRITRTRILCWHLQGLLPDLEALYRPAGFRCQPAKNNGALWPSPPTPDPGVSLAVLFCKDGAMIREPLGQLLAVKGLKVLLASSGTEALELAGANDFDALVTDLGLPDMPGTDLARRIREARPQCPVVFASGRNADVPDGFSNARVPPKPFSADALHAAIVAAVRED